MLRLMVGIFAFIFWPLYDIKRAQKIRGIGSGDERLDDDTVEKWKAGRIFAKRLWMVFGMVILTGMLLDYGMGFYFPVDANGEYADAAAAGLLDGLILTFVFVGSAGFLGGLIYNGWNNKKHLGQFHVSVR